MSKLRERAQRGDREQQDGQRHHQLKKKPPDYTEESYDAKCELTTQGFMMIENPRKPLLTGTKIYVGQSPEDLQQLAQYQLLRTIRTPESTAEVGAAPLRIAPTHPRLTARYVLGTSAAPPPVPAGSTGGSQPSSAVPHFGPARPYGGPGVSVGACASHPRACEPASVLPASSPIPLPRLGAIPLNQALQGLCATPPSAPLTPAQFAEIQREILRLGALLDAAGHLSISSTSSSASSQASSPPPAQFTALAPTMPEPATQMAQPLPLPPSQSTGTRSNAYWHAGVRRR